MLEGGAIDSNGAGVLLTTEECLLSSIQEESGPRYAAAMSGRSANTRHHTTIWLGEGCVGVKRMATSMT